MFIVSLGLLPATIPRAVSHTNQSDVVSVRLIITNLAPLVKPQSIVVRVPVPVYEPTFETLASVANPYQTAVTPESFYPAPAVTVNCVLVGGTTFVPSPKENLPFALLDAAVEFKTSMPVGLVMYTFL